MRRLTLDELDAVVGGFDTPGGNGDPISGVVITATRRNWFNPNTLTYTDLVNHVPISQGSGSSDNVVEEVQVTSSRVYAHSGIGRVTTDLGHYFTEGFRQYEIGLDIYAGLAAYGEFYTPGAAIPAGTTLVGQSDIPLHGFRAVALQHNNTIYIMSNATDFHSLPDYVADLANFAYPSLSAQLNDMRGFIQGIMPYTNANTIFVNVGHSMSGALALAAGLQEYESGAGAGRVMNMTFGSAPLSPVLNADVAAWTTFLPYKPNDYTATTYTSIRDLTISGTRGFYFADDPLVIASPFGVGNTTIFPALGSGNDYGQPHYVENYVQKVGRNINP